SARHLADQAGPRGGWVGIPRHGPPRPRRGRRRPDAADAGAHDLEPARRRVPFVRVGVRRRRLQHVQPRRGPAAWAGRLRARRERRLARALDDRCTGRSGDRNVATLNHPVPRASKSLSYLPRPMLPNAVKTAVKKAPRSTLRGQLVGRVLTSIFSGEMKGGDRLIEEELAANLGVRRTPIREAPGELADIGVMPLKPSHV